MTPEERQGWFVYGDLRRNYGCIVHGRAWDEMPCWECKPRDYRERMPAFETAAQVFAYLESRGESVERHDHLLVPDAWQSHYCDEGEWVVWVCEVPGCHWKWDRR